MVDLSTDSDKEENWLSLAEAAKRLNVHPSTLRRWANKGHIPTMVTPGGHRRFALSDIDRFVQDHGAIRTHHGIAGVWASKAIVHVQQEMEEETQQIWLARFDDEARQQNQALGHKLMGLILQYLSTDLDDEYDQALLEEGQRIGHQYGLNALHLGMTLREALRTSIFFRDNLMKAAIELPATVNVRPEKNVRLMRRLNRLLNVIHLAVAEVYDDGITNNLHRN
ncbi:MAG: helix-turn-helix domain-containing protein [Chloroflexota bacterium]|jgi:excisionase family DNA binding protein